MGGDVLRMVIDFFRGNTQPELIIHANLVLFLKKEWVHEFTDLRPISLSKFINKIISRLVNNRIDGLLPRLVSPNQSDFIKGRSVIENILLT